MTAGELGGLRGKPGTQMGVDVVDGQGVVVVCEERWHLLDAGGNARHSLDLELRGLPTPFPCGWCPLPFPPLPPLGPAVLLAVARIPPPLLAPGPPPCPWPLAPARPIPLAALPMSLTLTRTPSASDCALAFPVRLSSPAAASAFALPVPLPPSAAARALALPLRLPPPPAAARAVARPWCLPPSSAASRLSTIAFLSLPCAPAFSPMPRPIAVSSVFSCPLLPCLDHATLQLRQRDVHRRAFGHRGANAPWPPFREGGLGRVRPGGLGWVWLGRVWARYSAPSIPSVAAAAAPGGLPGEAPWARAGPVPRAGGVPGAAARSAAAAAGASCGRSDGLSGAPPAGGAAGATAWAVGAASPAGNGSGTGGLGSPGAAWGCPAGGLTGTAASARRRSFGSAGVSPAHPEETGERERDRWWWRSARWGEPSESDIAVTLSRVRGCRCAYPTTSHGIGGVPWVVPCADGVGEGGVAVAPGGHGPVVIHRP